MKKLKTIFLSSLVISKVSLFGMEEIPGEENRPVAAEMGAQQIAHDVLGGVAIINGPIVIDGHEINGITPNPVINKEDLRHIPGLELGVPTFSLDFAARTITRENHGHTKEMEIWIRNIIKEMASPEKIKDIALQFDELEPRLQEILWEAITDNKTELKMKMPFFQIISLSSKKNDFLSKVEISGITPESILEKITHEDDMTNNYNNFFKIIWQTYSDDLTIKDFAKNIVLSLMDHALSSSDNRLMGIIFSVSLNSSLDIIKDRFKELLTASPLSLKGASSGFLTIMAQLGTSEDQIFALKHAREIYSQEMSPFEKIMLLKILLSDSSFYSSAIDLLTQLIRADISHARIIKGILPLEQGRFVDPIIREYVLNQAIPEREKIDLFENLIIFDPTSIDSEMMLEFQYALMKSLTDPDNHDFHTLENLLANPITTKMGEGLLQEFLKLKLYNHNQITLSFSMERLANTLKNEELKTQIQTAFLEKIQSSELSWDEKLLYMYQFCFLTPAMQDNIVTFIIETSISGAISHVHLAKIIRFLLEDNHGTKKQELERLIVNSIKNPNLDFGAKSLYMDNFRALTSVTQDELTTFILTSMREGNMTHAQFLKIANFLTQREDVQNFIVNIIISSDISLYDKGLYMELFRSFSPEAQDKIITFMLESITSGTISHIQFATIMKYLLINNNGTKIQDLETFVIDYITNPILDWETKVLYMSNFAVFGPNTQDRMISFFLDTTIEGSITHFQFCDTIGYLLTTQNEDQRNNLKRFIADMANNASLNWESRIPYFKKIYLLSQETQSEIGFQTLESIRAGAITHEQFCDISSFLFEMQNDLLKRELANLVLEIAQNPRTKSKVKRILLENLISCPRTQEFNDILRNGYSLLKQEILNPDFVSLRLQERREAIRNLLLIKDHTDIDPFIELLGRNIDFEQTYIALDQSFNYENVHNGTKTSSENIILQGLVEQEPETNLSSQELIDAIRVHITKLQKIKQTQNTMNEEQIKTLVDKENQIAIRLPQDVLETALQHLQMIESCMQNPESTIGAWGNLWSKKAFQHEITVKEKDKSDLIFGRILELVFNRIIRDPENEEYIIMMSSFINGLGSPEAILNCGTGAFGGIIDSLLPLLKKTEKRFDTEARYLLDAHIRQLKNFMVTFFDNRQETSLTQEIFSKTDPDFAGQLIGNEVISYFLNHVKTQDWTPFIQPGESLASVYDTDAEKSFLMDRLFLDLGVRSYFSEFQKEYIRNGSLGIDLINGYLKAVQDL